MFVQQLEPVADSLALSALVAALPLVTEGDLLRKVLPWSLGLLLVLCLIVMGQSTPVLGWMLP
ncbi:hypothetical protein [Streptomyces sp. H27-C3]|uniref:hypothetical protein n=1 Tax=Streptomyces sp. H27-C3 TaxID=3046305 RepID=UPI0024B9007C|nr:hypothetical protein [Streptomyces sp. H27-C3]MDJ0460346.1 hypothetical protein [Streptomyces sp. H27-C3]